MVMALGCMAALLAVRSYLKEDKGQASVYSMLGLILIFLAVS